MEESQTQTGWQTMQQCLVNADAALTKALDHMQRENLFDAYAVDQIRYAAQQIATTQDFLRCTEAITRAMMRSGAAPRAKGGAA